MKNKENDPSLLKVYKPITLMAMMGKSNDRLVVD